MNTIIGDTGVKRINVAERAKQIEERLKKGPTPINIDTTAVRTADPATRSEIQSREKGYQAPESNVNYGIRRSTSVKKEESNIISDCSSPKINCADRAKEIQRRREQEYLKLMAR
jgi:hypothetical protein